MSTKEIPEAPAYELDSLDSMTVSMAFLVVCANNQLKKQTAELCEKTEKAHKKLEKYHEILRGIEENMEKIMQIIHIEKSVDSVHKYVEELRGLSEDLLRSFQGFVDDTRSLENVVQNIDWTGHKEEDSGNLEASVDKVIECRGKQEEFESSASSFGQSIEACIRNLDKITNRTKEMSLS